MDGFIIVNKPQGFTSHDVCNKLRGILKTKKIGHSGTLDPLATGVLVVGVGKATKLLNYLENHTKTYVAEALFGYQTDTYDILGKTIIEDSNYKVDETSIDEALSILIDKKTQLPPIYSAIKVNGKKLYDYARNNEFVEIEPREIKIDTLKRVSKIYDNKVLIEVSANKGFYVRSLIHDLALELNTCATMSKLTRTRAGNYDLSCAQTLEDIINNGPKIYSIEDTFSYLDKIEVNDYIAKLVRNGVVLDERQFSKNEMFRVYHNDKLIAIYEPKENNKYGLVTILGE